MGEMIVRSSSGGLAVNNGPSVLGEQQAKIPVGGTIRPGIKVLTSAAAQNAKAKTIYAAGVAAGRKWDAIEKQLMAECGFDRSPLTPRNVRYFSVFRDDFTNPANAAQLLELYGEDYEGERRLLRFPVVLSTDSWQANLPHALQCYTSNELKYWSDYDNTGTRRCFTRQASTVDPKSKRAPRVWGGRPVIPRADNQGICDPDVCPQYQNRACNLKGKLLFFVPGVMGAGAISLPLTSFYGMEQARKTMTMVAFLRGGRLSGTHDGKPIFYITKTRQEIQMLDQTSGQPKKVPHWIVTLEADIDMLQVFKAAEQRLLASAASDAALALSAPEHLTTAVTVVDEDGAEDLHAEKIEAAPTQQSPAFTEAKDGRALVAAKLADMNITPLVFGSWMVAQTGDADWGKKTKTLLQAYDLLTEAQESGDVEGWKRANSLDIPF